VQSNIVYWNIIYCSS